MPTSHQKEIVSVCHQWVPRKRSGVKTQSPGPLTILAGAASRPGLTVLTPGPLRLGRHRAQEAVVGLLPLEQQGPSITPQAQVHS